MSVSNVDRILVLESEIEYLRTEIRPSATGHIHTAIYVLELRLEDLWEELSEEDQTWLALKR